MATSRREFVWRSVAAASTVLVPPGCDRRGLGAAVPIAKKADLEFEPGYLKLEREGELEKREKALWEILASCEICARGCGADRLSGETGVCSTPARIKVHSAGPHYGEERELVGGGGDGACPDVCPQDLELPPRRPLLRHQPAFCSASGHMRGGGVTFSSTNRGRDRRWVKLALPLSPRPTSGLSSARASRRSKASRLPARVQAPSGAPPRSR